MVRFLQQGHNYSDKAAPSNSATPHKVMKENCIQTTTGRYYWDKRLWGEGTKKKGSIKLQFILMVASTIITQDLWSQDGLSEYKLS